MKPFTYHAPRSVEEALSLLEQHQASCAVVAGGTDVVIELNEGVKRPEHVIDISKISELRYVKEEDGLVKLGALDTFTSLERHPYVQEHLPALYETVIHVGSPRDPGTWAPSAATWSTPPSLATRPRSSSPTGPKWCSRALAASGS